MGCLTLDLPKDSQAQKMIDAVHVMFDLLYRLEVLPSMWRHYPTRNLKKLFKAMDDITSYVFLLYYLKGALSYISKISHTLKKNLNIFCIKNLFLTLLKTNVAIFLTERHVIGIEVLFFLEKETVQILREIKKRDED